MNILDSLNINSDKLINNDALRALRGGLRDHPCGPDSLGYNCIITPCEGCSNIEGIACGNIDEAGVIFDALEALYPELVYYECAVI